ncbi:hypothetical protein BDR06DRAFT_515126 [Suillus hirtellus]|nr:hypothetical protein BDR06DRAFT_515126 [Suillus hirtellus]
MSTVLTNTFFHAHVDSRTLVDADACIDADTYTDANFCIDADGRTDVDLRINADVRTDADARIDADEPVLTQIPALMLTRMPFRYFSY